MSLNVLTENVKIALVWYEKLILFETVAYLIRSHISLRGQLERLVDSSFSFSTFLILVTYIGSSTAL